MTIKTRNKKKSGKSILRVSNNTVILYQELRKTLTITILSNTKICQVILGWVNLSSPLPFPVAPLRKSVAPLPLPLGPLPFPLSPLPFSVIEKLAQLIKEKGLNYHFKCLNNPVELLKFPFSVTYFSIVKLK